MEFPNLEWDCDQDAQFEVPACDFSSSFEPFPESDILGNLNNHSVEPDMFGSLDCIDGLAVDTSFFDSYDDLKGGFQTIDPPSQRATELTPGGDSSKSNHTTTESDSAVDGCHHSVELPAGRSRRRFPRESVQLLKAWLREHAKNPYPTDREMDELKKETGMKRSQIRTWLANTRRRSKLDTPNCASTTTPLQSGSSASCSSSSASDIQSYNDLTPFARWRMLSPEQEPIPIPTIASALGFEPPQYPENGTFCEYRDHQSDILSVSTATRPSMTTGLTATSGPSTFSYGHAGSLISSSRSHATLGATRRRKVRISKSAASNKATDVKKIYQCTFCTNSFKTKYDWQRHEKAIHFSPESWICAPSGPIHMNSIGTTSCVFCGLENPTAKHIESHDYSSCADKPLAKRSFYRKDHLRQHLRLFHKTTFNEKIMNSWVKHELNISSRCGICNLSMTTWPERVEHLAEHFENGQGMELWKGGHGFPPCVEAVVENSMTRSSVLSSLTNDSGGGQSGSMLPPIRKEDESGSMLPPASTLRDRIGPYLQTAKTTDVPVTALTQADIDDLVALGLSYE